MKYLRQLGIIMVITFMGEMLKEVIPLAIPASIYGLLLMLAALMTKAVRLEDVKETADFLIEIMPVMFIPAAAELVVSWSILQDILIPVIVITLVTTVAVMAVSGRVTQSVIRFEKKRKEKNERNNK
ncbi:MAG: CidA/LrgA family protein [Lachnospiraceae bacterium]